MKEKKISQLKKARKSNWLQKEFVSLKDEKWLFYSSQIARRVLAALEDKEGMSQKEFAESLGVKPQYINKVVKGSQNLSLKTIANISAALNFELITFPAYKDSFSSYLNNSFKYVDNSSNIDKEDQELSKTTGTENVNSLANVKFNLQVA